MKQLVTAFIFISILIIGCKKTKPSNTPACIPCYILDSMQSIQYGHDTGWILKSNPTVTTNINACLQYGYPPYNPYGFDTSIHTYNGLPIFIVDSLTPGPAIITVPGLREVYCPSHS